MRLFSTFLKWNKREPVTNVSKGPWHSAYSCVTCEHLTVVNNAPYPVCPKCGTDIDVDTRVTVRYVTTVVFEDLNIKEHLIKTEYLDELCIISKEAT